MTTDRDIGRVPKPNDAKVASNLIHHRGDYEWAANQYRGGKRIQWIADQIGVTRGKLFDYFSDNGISRDLTLEIRNRTNKILAEDVVDMTQARQTTDPEQIIAINATLQASIIRNHRQDIARYRRLAMALLSELEGLTVYQDLFEDLGVMLRAEDDKGRDQRNDLYNRVIALPQRTKSMKELADVLKIVIPLERQAFGMQDDYEDSEIRREKMRQALPEADRQAIEEDYSQIASKFMKVLQMNGSKVEDATIVEDKSADSATGVR